MQELGSWGVGAEMQELRCRSLYVPDDAGFLWGNLGVLDQLGKVLLADPVLRLDVEQDDSGGEGS